MAEGPTHIFVLAEDREQQNLIRHYLTRSGLGAGARFEALPNGIGSGEQFVRNRFPELLRKVESSLGHAVSAIAIVMIDADLRTVIVRRSQLIGAQGSTNDLILLIPKRHVETWVGALLGNTVDELKDYKADFGNATMVKQAAQALFAVTRPNAQVPVSFPPSLQTALLEWKKIR
jgi:hypothetical protein